MSGIVDTSGLAQDVQRIAELTESFRRRVDSLLAEKDQVTVAAFTHADLCQRLVHVDSVEKAAEILVEAAVRVDGVDSVQVWVKRMGARNPVKRFGAFQTETVPPERLAAGDYDLEWLRETFVERVPEIRAYYPVHIYHPGNGVVGLVEYGSAVTSDFTEVSHRVLRGLTNSAATVIGRLAICEKLSVSSLKYDALSKASNECIAVFYEGSVFATNQAFDLLVGDAAGGIAKEELDKVHCILQYGIGFHGRDEIGGVDVHAKVVGLSVQGKDAIAVVLTPWLQRGEGTCLMTSKLD